MIARSTARLIVVSYEAASSSWLSDKLLDEETWGNQWRGVIVIYEMIW